MTTRCRTGTRGCGSQELDRELSDALIAISVVSKRIADRITAVSGREKKEYGRRKPKWER
nr:MAG TPA: hypothetical protein [Caudoviricetes sp.]